MVRHVRVDSGSLLAGAGAIAIHFTVTHAARVRTRIVGAGGEVTIDSSLASGPDSVRWTGLMKGARPATSGSYRVIIDASAGSDAYSRAASLRVIASPVDTLTHLTSLPGYNLFPEMTEPPRSWRPFGVAALVTAGVTGAALALENPKLGTPSKTPLLVVSGGALLIGGLAVARKPAAEPNTANIRYNNLVKEQLAKRNAEIALENARRRTEVRLTVREDKSGGASP